MRRQAGFSLRELVAVMAIFALDALIGVQVIQASVRSSERLTKISDESADLAVALAQLRQDLDMALALPFTTPSGTPEPALLAGDGGFALTVGGIAVLGDGSGQGRVVWRHDPVTETLVRQLWPTRIPASGRAAGPDIAVLEDVTALSISSYTARAGWRAGFANDPRNPDDLPLGLRVRIEHARLGALETVVSFR